MKRKIVGIFVMMLMIGTAIIPMLGENNIYSSSTFMEVLDQYQDWSDSCNNIDDYEWQEFIPTMDNLVRVEVKVIQWYEDSPDLKLTVEKPLGNVLTYKEKPASAIPDSCDWTSFNVPDIDLTPGESYYIKLTAPLGSEYGWGIAYNNLYPQGTSSQYPADWCFRTYAEEAGNLPPSVSITYPKEGDTVNGEIIITGEAHDPEGDSNLEWVKVKFDNGYWQYASGTSLWSYVLDTITLDDGEHTISAKSYDGILESTAYSITISVDNGGEPSDQPDLIVTDVWDKDDEVCYQIRNIGNASAPSGHYTALSIDGEYQVSDLVNTVLSPGERYTACFDYDWGCNWLNVSIKVVNDYENDVDESNEANNERLEWWKCDNIAPEIISGPVVQLITQSTAVIYWRTDEDCDSKVCFDYSAGEYDEIVVDDDLVGEHSVKLTDLNPGTTYHFMVESMDISDNKVISRDHCFETSPRSDNKKPSISFKMSKNLSSIANISVEALDNIGVDKVIFSCEGKQIGTDYSPPFEWFIDTVPYDDGDIELSADVYDSMNNIDRDTLTGEVRNHYPPEDVPFEIILYPPDPANPMNRDVYWIWNIQADIIPDPIDGLCIHHWNLSINNEVKDEDYPYIDRPCWMWNGTGPRPYTPSEHIWYSWDTTGLPEGDYVVAVEAVDEGGNKLRRSILVEKVEETWEDLKLSINRIVTWHDNYVKVMISIQNEDTFPVDNLMVMDEVKGYQATTSDFGVSIKYALRKTQIQKEISRLNPGSICTFTYYLVPILFYPLLSSYEIGRPDSTIKISYNDPGGTWHQNDYPCHSIVKTIDGISTLFQRADYLIVTDPDNLYREYDFNDVNELLTTVAKLARLKNGVLAYTERQFIDSYGLWSLIMEDVGDLYVNKGAWYERLCPDHLGGGPFNYLLLVGDDEIVPSFNWPIHYHFNGNTVCPQCGMENVNPVLNIRITDLPYADTDMDGNLLPDLRVGRIIGDNVQDLLKPIQASISTSFIKNEFRDQYVLLVSGPDGTWENFVKETNNICYILEGQGARGTPIHSEYNLPEIDLLREALVIRGDFQCLGDPATCACGKTHPPMDLPTLRTMISIPEAETVEADRRGVPGTYDTSYTTGCDAMAGSARAVKSTAIGKDIIYWAGHGNEQSWACVLDDHVVGGCGISDIYIGGSSAPSVPAINFGGIHPVVFTGSCLTGNYNSWCSIAKAFLRHGAAVYVGATEVSPCGVDPMFWDRFFRMWPYSRGYPMSVGEGMRLIKDLALKFHGLNGRYWALEYNLYGDPKFTLPYFSSQSISNSDSFIVNNYYAEMPPSTLEVEIPDYEVNTVGGYDYVEIPGGGILSEEDGRPRVPYYTTSIDFSKSYRIQDLILRERSGLITSLDLELPVVVNTADTIIPLDMKEGWYPDEDYTWNVWENNDGNNTLVISMYPFYYNSDTTQVKFYKNYIFDIEYIQSDISISSLYTDKDCYKPGEEVNINMWLDNSGEIRNIVTSFVVKSYGIDNIEEGLSMRTLKNFEGICSSSVTWDTSSVEKGNYYIEATISDLFGNTLDRMSQSICISFGDIEIKSITGGFGISTEVRNNDTENMTDVHWSITIEGDMVLFGGYKEGVLPILMTDESKTVKSGLIFGFGPAEITVNIAGETKKVDCFILGPFVISISD